MIKTLDKKNVTLNVLLLVLTRFFTISFGLISTRLLSNYFSYDEYGTYSQLLLLINSFSHLTILGMGDASVFYYNRDSLKNSYEYIYNILGFQFIIGMIGAFILISGSGIISQTLNNALLKKYIPFIIFIPMLDNILSILSSIIVAMKETKSLLIHNILYAILKLCGILFAVLLKNNIIILFCTMFISDIIFLCYYILIIKNNNLNLKLMFSYNIWKKILSFSLPIGLYILIRSLLGNTDKFIISILGTINEVSIYANGSYQLPFNIVWNSTQTLLIPILSSNILMNNHKFAFETFSSFMRVNIIFTTPFVIFALIESPEIISILFSNKYLASIPIFRLYTMIELFNFFGLTVIITTANQSKYLFKISFIMLLLNCILNVIFYKSFGIIGPALSTLIISALMTIFFLKKSVNILQESIIQLMKSLDCHNFYLNLVILSIITILIRLEINKLDINIYLRLIIVAVFFFSFFIITNYKSILSAIRVFNKTKL